MAKSLKSLAIFDGLFSVWQKTNLLWQILCSNGLVFIVVNVQILKIIKRYLVTLLPLLPTHSSMVYHISILVRSIRSQSKRVCCHYYVPSPSVRPDWAKFLPFGALLKYSGHFESIHLVFGIILT